MWNVPAHHKMFSELNTAQWLWYFHNFMEDQEEEFENSRDLIEYHASFIEPAAVKKIRDARDKAVEVSANDFASGIERILGRKFNVARRTSGNEVCAADPTKAMGKYKSENKPIKPTMTNYTHWQDSDLE